MKNARVTLSKARIVIHYYLLVSFYCSICLGVTTIIDDSTRFRIGIVFTMRNPPPACGIAIGYVGRGSLLGQGYRRTNTSKQLDSALELQNIEFRNRNGFRMINDVWMIVSTVPTFVAILGSVISCKGEHVNIHQKHLVNWMRW